MQVGPRQAHFDQFVSHHARPLFTAQNPDTAVAKPATTGPSSSNGHARLVRLGSLPRAHERPGLADTLLVLRLPCMRPPAVKSLIPSRVGSLCHELSSFLQTKTVQSLQNHMFLLPMHKARSFRDCAPAPCGPICTPHPWFLHCSRLLLQVAIRSRCLQTANLLWTQASHQVSFSSQPCLHPPNPNPHVTLIPTRLANSQSRP